MKTAAGTLTPVTVPGPAVKAAEPLAVCQMKQGQHSSEATSAGQRLAGEDRLERGPRAESVRSLKAVCVYKPCGHLGSSRELLYLKDRGLYPRPRVVTLPSKLPSPSCDTGCDQGLRNPNT